MSPYRESALVLAPRSSRFDELWVKLFSFRCKGSHAWYVIRYWDFEYDPQMRTGVGHDAVCQRCGRRWESFRKVGEILRRFRYLKFVDRGATKESLLRARLETEVSPIPKGHWTYPRSYREVWIPGSRVFSFERFSTPVEVHYPSDCFYDRYVFEGREIPEYLDDEA